jgi:ornithine cyclodeaminase/alanine dehydrogenase-like protein (mu-crystallin family)
MTPTVSNATVVLNRSDIRSLIDFKDFLLAMEQVFRLHGGGQTLSTGLLHIDALDGEFHVKAGGIRETTDNRAYFGVKVNGGFFHNEERYGLPSIQGCILLFDATTGSPLALFDSVDITRQRTAATTTLAALHLAKKHPQTMTVIGTGRQARVHLEGMVRLLEPQRVYVAGRELTKCQRLADKMSPDLNVPIEATTDVRGAVRASDIVVTCTASREPLFQSDDVQPGTFIAAVGADAPGKQELDPDLLRRSKIVVDLTIQCIRVGELQHAIGAGLLTPEKVHAELGEIVARRKPGRLSDDEIIIFDSTGTALQDVAAAALIDERAIETSRGERINLCS